MSARLICVICLIVLQVTLGKERRESCLTPNNEQATCKPIDECSVISNAIKSQDKSALDFAQKSQCGYDTSTLVCCGTKAFLNAEPTPAPEVIDQNAILANFETGALPDRTVCGLEKKAQRVVGGAVTELDEFPWMAALEYTSKITKQNAGIRCGGSVINNRFILTAAHCIIDEEFELIGVWLGEWNISSDPDCQDFVANTKCADAVVKLQIKEQIPHLYYSKKTGNNDIGLLRLEKDITYSDYIRPICLPPANLPNPPVNTEMTVAGWGATENGTSSDVKMKVAVPLLSNDVCNAKLSKSKPLTPNQLCAGGEEGKDSCQGDSGGPLMRTYQDAQMSQVQWYQEGVISRGVGCAGAGYPAIYTRVSRYISWIINNISEDE